MPEIASSPLQQILYYQVERRVKKFFGGTHVFEELEIGMKKVRGSWDYRGFISRKTTDPESHFKIIVIHGKECIGTRVIENGTENDALLRAADLVRLHLAKKGFRDVIPNH